MVLNIAVTIRLLRSKAVDQGMATRSFQTFSQRGITLKLAWKFLLFVIFAIIFQLQNGTEVRALMPVADNATFRKKTLWKTVFEGFDKIDGVPSPAEREVSYTSNTLAVMAVLIVSH